VKKLELGEAIAYYPSTELRGAPERSGRVEGIGVGEFKLSLKKLKRKVKSRNKKSKQVTSRKTRPGRILNRRRVLLRLKADGESGGQIRDSGRGKKAFTATIHST
jgi:hypothetical protein